MQPQLPQQHILGSLRALCIHSRCRDVESDAMTPLSAEGMALGVSVQGSAVI